MPLVSVVIPTHNRAQVVKRAIYSVYRQTFRDLEILVIDDCSSDDTANQIDGMLSRFSGLGDLLVYKRLERNRGANAARNVGVSLARGRYIAFLDSDDLWHPQKLERQLASVRSEQPIRPAFSFTGRFRVDANYQVLARQLPRAATASEAALRRGNGIGTLSAVLVEKKAVTEIGGFDEDLRACQDWDFYLRLAPHCHIVAVREPLVMYYDGGIDRISRSGRARIAAHVAIYRKHQSGRVAMHELAGLYRSIAEDLEQLEKHRWAQRFAVTHQWLRGNYRRAIGMAFERPRPALREQRYASYAKQELARTDKESDAPYLSAYRELLEAALD